MIPLFGQHFSAKTEKERPVSVNIHTCLREADTRPVTGFIPLPVEAVDYDWSLVVRVAFWDRIGFKHVSITSTEMSVVSKARSSCIIPQRKHHTGDGKERVLTLNTLTCQHNRLSAMIKQILVYVGWMVICG